MTIRFAVKEDAVRLAQLEQANFAEPWSQAAIEEAMDYGTLFFVSEQDGLVVGYAGMKPVSDEGYIANVAVDESFRRQGIAKALMEAVTAYAQENGLATLSLEVRPSNQGAIALYTACGYKQVGRRKNFYSNPQEDGLILTRKVEPYAHSQY